ncbi:MAG TPA: hypothetical protein VGF13_15700, partial [Verrucomicrobiae bacterium]
MVGALCLLLSVLASALQGEPITSSNRFLFIIDTSAAMKPLETKLRETVFDLIYSGLRGQMTNGDTYGIWLLNGQNNTSFPMETWKHKHILELAAGAASYVKTNGTKGKAHLEVAFADVQNVLKNVGDLTVILVTDGSTPIMGTRFDDAINARWRETAPGLKRAKVTLNTVLVAQDGEFVAWAANSPEFLIDIPLVKPKPRPARVEVAATNAPPLTPATVASESVAAAKPRAASPPIIITRETVAQEKRSYYSSTAPNETSPVAQVATNAVPEVVPAAATHFAVVTNTEVTDAIIAGTAPETAPTDTRPAISSTPIATVEPVSIESVSFAPAKAPAVGATSSEGPSAVRTALLWASVGAGAMLGCVMMVA